MASDTTRECVRDVILDAADRLMGLYGYKKTTVDDIAHEAGIGKGTVYLHFHSKEEIALCWIDRVNARLRGKLDEIAQSGGSTRERLREMLLTRVMYRLDAARGHTKGVDELLAALRPRLHEHREQWHCVEAVAFAKVLSEGRDAGLFTFDDAEATARSLLLATNSLLPYNLSAQQLGGRKRIAENASRVADLLLSGIVTRNCSNSEDE